MLDLFMLPFTIIGWIFNAILWIVMLPFKILFGMMGFAFGVVSFIVNIGLWLACIALCVAIGRNRGLHPLLCGALGAFLGPVGLLIVIGLALLRSPRYT